MSAATAEDLRELDALIPEPPNESLALDLAAAREGIGYVWCVVEDAYGARLQYHDPRYDLAELPDGSTVRLAGPGDAALGVEPSAFWDELPPFSTDREEFYVYVSALRERGVLMEAGWVDPAAGIRASLDYLRARLEEPTP